MNLRIGLHWIKWPATLAALAGFLALAYWIHSQARAAREDESRSDRVEQERLRDEPGEVTLPNPQADYPLARAEGIANWVESVTLYGRVVPNPRATFEVRSPFAGVVRPGDHAWPTLGQWIAAKTPLGRVDVRVPPEVRLDWQSKLNEAREQEKGARRVREIVEERVKRFQNAPQGIPPRELEEALIQLREVETRQAAARSNRQLWETALAEVRRLSQPPGSRWTRSLTAPADGEITELLASPGTTVEAGSVVARLVDFRKLLVQLDFPPGFRSEPPSSVQVRTAPLPPPALRGPFNRPLPGKPPPTAPARLLGPSPRTEPAGPFLGYLYEVEVGEQSRAARGWRPGMFIQADIPGATGPEAPARRVVSVPAASLLYYEGRAIIYVRVRRGKGRTTYARREVQVLGRNARGWLLVVTEQIKPGIEVVARGAADLLSREFNADTDD
jgi:multidrug efflux pump subunit AcrA (membrane-fusion protein)